DSPVWASRRCAAGGVRAPPSPERSAQGSLVNLDFAAPARPAPGCVRPAQRLTAAFLPPPCWGSMSAEKFAFAVAVAVFAGGALGLILQRMLPEKFTTG